jgi:hypothetical protein
MIRHTSIMEGMATKRVYMLALRPWFLDMARSGRRTFINLRTLMTFRSSAATK